MYLNFANLPHQLWKLLLAPNIWDEMQEFSWIPLLGSFPLFEPCCTCVNSQGLPAASRTLSHCCSLYSSFSYLDFGNQFHERPAVIMSHQFHYELFKSWEFMDSALTSWTSPVQYWRRWFWEKKTNPIPHQIKLKKIKKRGRSWNTIILGYKVSFKSTRHVVWSKVLTVVHYCHLLLKYLVIQNTKDPEFCCVPPPLH